MKIITFTPYYPPFRGGLSSHAFEFDELLSKKHSVTVFTSNTNGTNIAIEKIHPDFIIIRFPAFEIIPNFPVPKIWTITFWRLFIGLFHNDYDIVISRIRFFNTSILALIFAKLKKLPWLHIEHTSSFITLSSKRNTLIAKWYDSIFGKLVLKKSSMNISISQAVHKFIGQFDKRPSPIIYRGLNFTELNEITENKTLSQKYPGKLIVLTACRLIKWKGVDLSIAAIKELPQEIKDKIIFLIIGDGGDFSEIEKLAKNEPYITLMGSLERKEVISIMKAAHIYIHSSLPGGGLSTSLLEAMYCNCAPIATCHEGADEIIHDQRNGLLIDHNFSKSLQKNIIKLIKSESVRTTIAKNAYLSIKESFDWKKSIQKYENIFNKLS